jgi:hypothetical protein
MSCKKNSFLQGVCVAIGLFATLVNLLQAQTTAVNLLQAPTTAVTVTDPGVRPTGKMQFGRDLLADCPVEGGKFPETPCIDFVQPRSVPPAPPADGAGQIFGATLNLAAPGNLLAFWFEGLSVFETPASVNGTDNSGTPGKFIRGLGPSFNA